MEKEELTKKFEGIQAIISRGDKIRSFLYPVAIIALIISIWVVIGNFHISGESLLPVMTFIFMIFLTLLGFISGRPLPSDQQLFYYSVKAKKFLELFVSNRSSIFIKKSKNILSSLSSLLYRDRNYDIVLNLPGIEDHPRFQVLGNLRKVLNKKVLPRVQIKKDLENVDKFLNLLSEFFYLQLPEIKWEEELKSPGYKEKSWEILDALYEFSLAMEEIELEKSKITIFSLTKTVEHKNIIIRFICWFIFVLPFSFILAFIAYRYFSSPISVLAPVVISVSVLGPAAIIGLQKP